MNDRARILFVAGDATAAERAADECRWRRNGAESVVGEPAAKLAAVERARTADAIIRWLVRIVGWLLIVGGFFALVNETTPDARVQRKADEAIAQIGPGGDSGIRPYPAE